MIRDTWKGKKNIANNSTELRSGIYVGKPGNEAQITAKDFGMNTNEYRTAISEKHEYEPIHKKRILEVPRRDSPWSLGKQRKNVEANDS